MRPTRCCTALHARPPPRGPPDFMFKVRGQVLVLPELFWGPDSHRRKAKIAPPASGRPAGAALLSPSPVRTWPKTCPEAQKNGLRILKIKSVGPLGPLRPKSSYFKGLDLVTVLHSRTGFRRASCRASAKIGPPAGRGPAGGPTVTLTRQESGRKPVRMRGSRAKTLLIRAFGPLCRCEIARPSVALVGANLQNDQNAETCKKQAHRICDLEKTGERRQNLQHATNASAIKKKRFARALDV